MCFPVPTVGTGKPHAAWWQRSRDVWNRKPCVFWLAFPISTSRTCHKTWQWPRWKENHWAGGKANSWSPFTFRWWPWRKPGTNQEQNPRGPEKRPSAATVPSKAERTWQQHVRRLESLGGGWGQNLGRWGHNRQQPSGRAATRPGAESCGAVGSSATAFLPKWRGGAEGRGGRDPTTAASSSPPAHRSAAEGEGGPAARLTLRGSDRHYAPPALRGAALTCPPRQSGTTWRLCRGQTLHRRRNRVFARPPPAELGPLAGGAEGGQLRRAGGPSFAESQLTQRCSHPISSNWEKYLFLNNLCSAVL